MTTGTIGTSLDRYFMRLRNRSIGIVTMSRTRAITATLKMLKATHWYSVSDSRECICKIANHRFGQRGSALVLEQV